MVPKILKVVEGALRYIREFREPSEYVPLVVEEPPTRCLGEIPQLHEELANIGHRSARQSTGATRRVVALTNLHTPTANPALHREQWTTLEGYTSRHHPYDKRIGGRTSILPNLAYHGSFENDDALERVHRHPRPRCAACDDP